jgi:8-oxo-dGTP diphosphatase
MQKVNSDGDSSGPPWPDEDPAIASFRGPHVAVDVALFTVVQGEYSRDNRLAFLLHRRQYGIAKNDWALPGRMVRERERLDDAVQIALHEKCGIKGIKPKQLHVFDEPTRDERGWVMSVAYATTQMEGVVNEVLENNQALALGFVEPRATLRLELPDGQQLLPFEQDEIVNLGVATLRRRYVSRPDPDRLLGSTFTLYQLRKIHEAIQGEEFDKDLFRRRMEPRLEPTSLRSSGSLGKPAQLFKRKTKQPAASAP